MLNTQTIFFLGALAGILFLGLIWYLKARFSSSSVGIQISGDDEDDAEPPAEINQILMAITEYRQHVYDDVFNHICHLYQVSMDDVKKEDTVTISYYCGEPDHTLGVLTLFNTLRFELALNWENNRYIMRISAIDKESNYHYCIGKGKMIRDMGINPAEMDKLVIKFMKKLLKAAARRSANAEPAATETNEES